MFTAVVVCEAGLITLLKGTKGWRILLGNMLNSPHTLLNVICCIVHILMYSVTITHVSLCDILR